MSHIIKSVDTRSGRRIKFNRFLLEGIVVAVGSPSHRITSLVKLHLNPALPASFGGLRECSLEDTRDNDVQKMPFVDSDAKV